MNPSAINLLLSNMNYENQPQTNLGNNTTVSSNNNRNSNSFLNDDQKALSNIQNMAMGSQTKKLFGQAAIRNNQKETSNVNISMNREYYKDKQQHRDTSNPLPSKNVSCSAINSPKRTGQITTSQHKSTNIRDNSANILTKTSNMNEGQSVPKIIGHPHSTKMFSQKGNYNNDQLKHPNDLITPGDSTNNEPHHIIQKQALEQLVNQHMQNSNNQSPFNLRDLQQQKRTTPMNSYILLDNHSRQDVKRLLQQPSWMDQQQQNHHYNQTQPQLAKQQQRSTVESINLLKDFYTNQKLQQNYQQQQLNNSMQQTTPLKTSVQQQQNQTQQSSTMKIQKSRSVINDNDCVSNKHDYHHHHHTHNTHNLEGIDLKYQNSQTTNRRGATQEHQDLQDSSMKLKSHLREGGSSNNISINRMSNLNKTGGGGIKLHNHQQQILLLNQANMPKMHNENGIPAANVNVRQQKKNQYHVKISFNNTSHLDIKQPQSDESGSVQQYSSDQVTRYRVKPTTSNNEVVVTKLRNGKDYASLFKEKKQAKIQQQRQQQCYQHRINDAPSGDISSARPQRSNNYATRMQEHIVQQIQQNQLRNRQRSLNNQTSDATTHQQQQQQQNNYHQSNNNNESNSSKLIQVVDKSKCNRQKVQSTIPMGRAANKAASLNHHSTHNNNSNNVLENDQLAKKNLEQFYQAVAALVRQQEYAFLEEMENNATRNPQLNAPSPQPVGGQNTARQCRNQNRNQFNTDQSSNPNSNRNQIIVKQPPNIQDVLKGNSKSLSSQPHTQIMNASFFQGLYASSYASNDGLQKSENLLCVVGQKDDSQLLRQTDWSKNLLRENNSNWKYYLTNQKMVNQRQLHDLKTKKQQNNNEYNFIVKKPLNNNGKRVISQTPEFGIETDILLANGASYEQILNHNNAQSIYRDLIRNSTDINYDNIRGPPTTACPELQQELKKKVTNEKMYSTQQVTSKTKDNQNVKIENEKEAKTENPNTTKEEPPSATSTVKKPIVNKFPPRKIVNPYDELTKEQEKFLQARKEAIQKYSKISANMNKPGRNQPFKYIIREGNNHQLIHRVMNQRGLNALQKLTGNNGSPSNPFEIDQNYTYWEESSTINNIFNFKWKPFSHGINYEPLSKHGFKQVVNHIEGHESLTTKDQLFLNMKSYYESQKQDVFQHLPLTFCVDFQNEGCQDQFEHICSVISLIEKNVKCSASQITKKMQKLQQLKEKVVRTHYSLSDTDHCHKNLWILKPTGFNRGVGIHVLNSVDELRTILWNIYKINTVNKCAQIHHATQKYSVTPPDQSIFEQETTNQNQNLAVDKSNTNSEQNLILQQDEETQQSTNATQPQTSVNKDKDNSNTNGTNGGAFFLPIIKNYSFIIQKYIERPQLFKNRKFDIRAFALISHDGRCYIYDVAYVRTSSEVYDLSGDKIDRTDIHLTNNAVQKHLPNYGKFEEGNIVSTLTLLEEMVRMEQSQGLTAEELNQKLIKQDMRQLIIDSIKAVKNKLTIHKYTFELVGYDFIITQDLKMKLIEVNTNPSLEESNKILQKILPRMIDDTFKIVLDPIFTSYPHAFAQHANDESQFPIDGYPANKNLWEEVYQLQVNQS